MSQAVLAAAAPPYLYQSEDNPDTAPLLLDHRRRCVAQGDARLHRAFGRTDFRADLAKVAVPTLVIHGDSDGIVPFEVSGKRAAEAILGSRLFVIEGGPHGINASHAEQFNAALLDFLKG